MPGQGDVPVPRLLLQQGYCHWGGSRARSLTDHSAAPHGQTGTGHPGTARENLRLLPPSESPCDSHAWSAPPTPDVFG